MSNPVPGPRGWPFIGNLLDLRNAEFPLMALNSLADQYGPIYKFTTPADTRIVVSSQKLVNELCDEKKFHKRGGAPIPSKGEKAPPAGLFFAKGNDPDWGIAHRILMPAFGPLSIANMFDEMHDIAKQLALSWARKGPSYRIDATGDFTRLTLDSIALCAMGYRFNSFYSDQQHPYVDAMQTFLEISGQRGQQLPIISRFVNNDAKLKAARETMGRIGKQLVDARRNNPNDKKDLLNAMMNGVDPKSGEKMSDGLIMANMNTFLIAGHETTSGMLSFAMYSLLKNAAAYKAAQNEVDEVLGGGALKAHHLKEFKYLNAVLRETLRLYPTAPAFTLVHNEDEQFYTLGDYHIEGNPAVMVLLQKLHRDPEVYGDDAELFKPERMLDEKFDKLPPNAWKPFGNGMRACIGRSFAWQEALMALAVLLQRFNFRLDDPSYDLRLKFALTIKPKDLFIRATLRHGIDPTDLEKALNSGLEDVKLDGNSVTASSANNGKGGESQVLSILYGSNTGTCEALAQKLAADASIHGFAAESAPLDSATGSLGSKGPAVIICSSYEGQPPDNAIHFVEWLQGLSGDELKGRNYAVFGCGHRDWHDTFHKVPKLIDDSIASRGGTRITALGTCDVAQSDVMDQFDAWKDKSFWPAFSQALDIDAKATDASIPHGLELEISTDHRAQTLRQDVSQAIVLDTQLLTQPGEPEKRHLELQLPTGMTYRAGDYLAVLPLNPAVTVRRVLKRYALPFDATIKLDGKSNPTSLPSGIWMAVADILKGFVELSQPPSTKDIRRFITLASEPAEAAALSSLLDSNAVQASHISTLDLLERFPSLALPFADFLSLLPPIRIRLYSISSSPLADPSICSVTYGVLSMPSPQGWSSARHPGVASSYLASLTPDDRLHVAVRPSRAGFHLPPAGISPPTPIIMICAGTGFAPFRAFVQERALQIAAQGPSKPNGTTANGGGGAAALANNGDSKPDDKNGGKNGGKDGGSDSDSCLVVGPALLFIGCRSPTKDRLYAAELADWEAQGGANLLLGGTRYAFSRESESESESESGSENGTRERKFSGGCKYVQARVRKDRAEVRALWDKGAKVYVCGASALVKEVGEVLREVLFDDSSSSVNGGIGKVVGENGDGKDGVGKVGGKEREKARMEGWARATRAERIVTDVFG